MAQGEGVLGTAPSAYTEQRYEYLDKAFLEVMNEIGQYGNDKYGEDSFHQRAKHGDRSRGKLARASSEVIIKHSQDHGDAYLAREPHDHFGTRKHQLAAAAFNAMMEFYFAGLENE